MDAGERTAEVDALAMLTAQADEQMRAGLRSRDGDDGLYEACVSLGGRYAEDEDSARWRLSELASLIGKRYGQNLLGAFANEINVSVRKLRESKQVFNFWTKDLLEEYTPFPLMYTHFRLAMHLAEDRGDKGAGIDFLQRCIEQMWSTSRAEVEQAKLMGKRVSPHQLLESPVVLVAVHEDRVVFLMSDPTARAALAHMEGVKGLTVKVFEPLENTLTETTNDGAMRPDGEAL